MAITYVNIGTRVDTGSGAAQTISYPAGIASGDLLIVFAAHRNGSTIAAPTSTLTWTEVANYDICNKAWTATYDGSATAPTMNTGGVSTYAVMTAIRGQATSSLDGFNNVIAVQINMRYPALTITNDNEIVFTFCFERTGITSVAQTSGFTEIEDFGASASGYGAQIQYQIQTAKTNIIQTDPVVTPNTTSATQIGITVAFIAKTTGGALLTSESNYGGF